MNFIIGAELNQQMHEIDKQDQGAKKQNECCNLGIEVLKEEHQDSSEVFVEENKADPVFVGTETPELEVNRGISSQMLDFDPEVQVFAWSEKAVASKNFVREKGTVAVLTVLRCLSGQLDAKIKDLFNDEPSPAAPLPPLPGEDDASGCGKAVEFGRRLVSQHFFQHVLDGNIFDDGNHLYRFLEHDPIVMIQFFNVPRGSIEVKPKPITEIASRLRCLSRAIFEAYASEDGRHVDYRSIHGSEEFKSIEGFQSVSLQN
ncbi:hypothetical protein OPV22_021550 [Ensete ventricosum]|uniref:Uncharacterized protein n=1 Tax=Ensete ventricosum TaxID=4639 RepID=A0AAV8QSH4_ENSVE|nr:hypothetical protein OPV22_021550 [Ensete ventricosum]